MSPEEVVTGLTLRLDKSKNLWTYIPIKQPQSSDWKLFNSNQSARWPWW